MAPPRGQDPANGRSLSWTHVEGLGTVHAEGCTVCQEYDRHGARDREDLNSSYWPEYFKACAEEDVVAIVSQLREENERLKKEAKAFAEERGRMDAEIQHLVGLRRKDKQEFQELLKDFKDACRSEEDAKAARVHIQKKHDVCVQRMAIANGLAADAEHRVKTAVLSAISSAFNTSIRERDFKLNSLDEPTAPAHANTGAPSTSRPLAPQDTSTRDAASGRKRERDEEGEGRTPKRPAPISVSKAYTVPERPSVTSSSVSLRSRLGLVPRSPAPSPARPSNADNIVEPDVSLNYDEDVVMASAENQSPGAPVSSPMVLSPQVSRSNPSSVADSPTKTPSSLAGNTTDAMRDLSLAPSQKVSKRKVGPMASDSEDYDDDGKAPNTCHLPAEIPHCVEKSSEWAFDDSLDDFDPTFSALATWWNKSTANYSSPLPRNFSDHRIKAGKKLFSLGEIEYDPSVFKHALQLALTGTGRVNADAPYTDSDNPFFPASLGAVKELRERAYRDYTRGLWRARFNVVWLRCVYNATENSTVARYMLEQGPIGMDPPTGDVMEKGGPKTGMDPQWDGFARIRWLLKVVAHNKSLAPDQRRISIPPFLLNADGELNVEFTWRLCELSALHPSLQSWGKVEFADSLQVLIQALDPSQRYPNGPSMRRWIPSRIGIKNPTVENYVEFLKENNFKDSDNRAFCDLRNSIQATLPLFKDALRAKANEIAALKRTKRPSIASGSRVTRSRTNQ